MLEFLDEKCEREGGGNSKESCLFKVIKSNPTPLSFPVTTVTISNSSGSVSFIFYQGEKFVDLAVRNARNTLVEVRKWGRDDGGSGGSGGGGGGGGSGDGDGGDGDGEDEGQESGKEKGSGNRNERGSEGCGGGEGCSPRVG